MNTHFSHPATTDLPLLFSAYQEFWQTLRRRQLRVLVMIVFGLAAGTLYCVLGGPWYDSTVQLLVVKKRLDTTPITGPNQAGVHEDYLSTHMLLITSRKVIVNAIAKGNLHSVEQFRDQDNVWQVALRWIGGPIIGSEPEGEREEKLASEIIRALAVSRDAQKPGISPSNEVLNLSFSGNVAADCPRVLNAIIASYQDFLVETYRNTNAETLELITQARTTVERDLTGKEVTYQKFLADTPPLWKAQDRSMAQQDRIVKIDAKLAALRVRRTEMEASIAMLEHAIKHGRDPTAIIVRMLKLRAAGEIAAPEPVAKQEPWFAEGRLNVSLEEELVRLQMQKAKLVAVNGSKHPDVLVLGRQMDALAHLILPALAAAPDRGPDLNLGAIKIALLKQELDDLKISEQALVKLFESEQKGVSAYYLHEIQDEALRKGIERDRLLYDSILNRLKETSTVKDFGGYQTQVIGPALCGTLALRKYVLVLGLSFMIGMFMGLTWAYVGEITRRQSAGPRPLPSES